MNTFKSGIVLIFLMVAVACRENPPSVVPVSPSAQDLVFGDLALSWDEGIPLGNGLIGGLVWQKGDYLRISLDRSDLWDLRPSRAFADPELTYDWLYQHRINDTYDKALEKLNSFRPGRYAPTKLPGGALEFDIQPLGKPEQVRLYLNNALCEISWNQATMEIFTHATKPVGWFRIKTSAKEIRPVLKTPGYEADREIKTERAGGQGYDILLLDYEQGKVMEGDNKAVYHQGCWGGFYYDIAVQWIQKEDAIEGVWSITSKFSEEKADRQVEEALSRGFVADYSEHHQWWENFWSLASISIPDDLLEKQWYNEMYKIGAASRSNTPPITLQAVWTADDNRLPPWRGDYHHDLNTQMSYWPFYSGNKLKFEQGFVDWLWEIVPNNEQFTRSHFGVEGLNVPGMTTLDGSPMFGWIQYAMSPTTSGWLTHHFYMHWKYSADPQFLKEKAYPYLQKVALFYEDLSVRGGDGLRKFPISSSPEIFNDSKEAWFTDITNYDLALVRFVYSAAGEMAEALNRQEEASFYYEMLSEWPEFDLDEEMCLTFAPGTPYTQSHRHFSHLMAFHPLGLIDWSKGEQDREIIRATIDRLDEVGPQWWTGYSYSWLGNLKARAMDGEGAAEALRDFAKHFCLKNTFHVNGDQTNSGKSGYTYKPFTLEGNFAFASGVNEMLMQSHTGVIHLFPAIPVSWENVSFDKLRAVGAFLVSAEKKDGKVSRVEILAEKEGLIRLMNPYPDDQFEVNTRFEQGDTGKIIKIPVAAEQKVVLTLKVY